jgi:hypothetical protein
MPNNPCIILDKHKKIIDFYFFVGIVANFYAFNRIRLFNNDFFAKSE